MFSAPSSELRIVLETETIFVHPESESEDPLVRGTVVLSLVKRRALRSLGVTFKGICDVKGGPAWPYETTPTLSLKLDLDLNGEIFEAGEHTFNFSFLLPSSSAVFHSSTFGRVRHHCALDFSFGPRLHWLTYAAIVKATVKFANLSGGSVASPFVPLWIFASAGGHGDLPEALKISIDHFHHDLGQIVGSLTSPHLTSASLVQAQLSFIAPEKRIKIISIKTSIHETFEILYNDASKRVCPPARRFELPILSKTTPSKTVVKGSPSSHSPLKQPMARIDLLSKSIAPPSSPHSTCHAIALSDDTYREEPLSLKLEPGNAMGTTFITRVPNSEVVRPTTLAGTNARIRVSHLLVVEIIYRV
ncbi:hypothetical protein P7C70_g816, partial [Phenoliferia sp. Uapishka_3]